MHERMRRELGRDVLDPLRQRALIGEEQPVGAAQVVDLLAGEAAPPQADDVEPARWARLPIAMP